MSSNKTTLEYDCTRKCKVHGNEINDALTKRAVSDSALASFMKVKCMNYAQSVDEQGRSSLHMVASRGRTSLLEWLAKQSPKAHLNLRDLESGYTALHRSIFYGQLQAAVLLYIHGVDPEILDNQSLRAIDHLLYDRIPGSFSRTMPPSEAYVWGNNTNYTLGTVSQQQRKVPELITSLVNQKGAPENIIQVCLGKFHSIWVCSGGGVWACGQAARCTGSLLKSSSPSSVAQGEMLVKPRPLKLPEPCIQAAVTLYGTVLLFNSGAVMQYGEDSGSSKVLVRLDDAGWSSEGVGGVRACRSGCIAWGPLHLYSWGNNKGNLGHDTNYMVLPTPKMVTCIASGRKDDKTTLLSADICDAATVVVNSRGDVYLLHNYQAKKILTKQLNVINVKIDAPDNGPISVLLLTNVGNLYHWQDTTATVARCIFSLKSPIFVTDMVLNRTQVLMTTSYGEAFFGSINPPPRGQPTPQKKSNNAKGDLSEFHKFLSKKECAVVQLERVTNIHRAVRVAKDFESANFAILQAAGDPSSNPKSKGPPRVSPSSLSEDLHKLRADDHLADVIFTIGARQYPCHIFVIAHYSEILYEQYLTNVSAGPTRSIPVEDIHPDIFEQLLMYFYSGSCELLQIGKCSITIRANNDEASPVISANPEQQLDINVSAFEVQQKLKQNAKTSDKRPKKTALLNPLKLLQDAAKKLQVSSLGKILDKYVYKDGYIKLKDSNTPITADKTVNKLDRLKFIDLCDTLIKCDGGSIIKAHRCVLSARLEYFNAMFAHTWSESGKTSEVSLPINSALLESIIKFVYTDDCSEIQQSQSLEQICSFLIVADQLFITRLREMCEQKLSHMINLKNCTEMCQFAETYNAEQLKRYCMEYILVNLYWYFENRALDILSKTLLGELTEFYMKSNSVMQSRVITPMSSAASDEIVLSCVDVAPVNLEEDFDADFLSEETTKKIKIRTNKRRTKHESVSSVDLLDFSNVTIGNSTTSPTKHVVAIAPEKKEEKTLVKIVSSQQKAVLARLRANTKAKEDQSILEMPSYYSNLAASPPKATIEPGITSKSPGTVISLSDLVDSTHGKLSQKQRKKIEAEQKLRGQIKIDPTPAAPVVSPWKIITEPPKLHTKIAGMQYFSDIMHDEVKQKENLLRMKSKSLNLTQMEDRAIEELKRFYDLLTMDEELITIKRNDTAKIATPQWIQHRH